MTITEDIDDIYILYLLCERNIRKVKELSIKSLGTLKKYITIKEQLESSLFPLLNNKELSLGIGHLLSKNVLNQDIQLQIFCTLKNKTTKEKEEQILSSKECMICSDSSCIHEFLSCCRNTICLTCLLNIAENCILDVPFQLIRCPYCRSSINLAKIEEHSSWGYLPMYQTIIQRYGPNYIKGLRIQYLYMRSMILNKKTWTEHQLRKRMDKKYYGLCHTCIKVSFGTKQKLKESFRLPIQYQQKQKTIRLGSLVKQCAGNNIEIKQEMFQCSSCKDKEKVEIKKCPHCGLQSIRPNECNYVKCDCKQFWCFICRNRLPGGHEGHNVHFWMEVGTSAFSNECRVTKNYPNSFHILNDCKCRHCRKRKGSPLCSTIDCMNNSSKNRRKYSETGILYNQLCDKCL